MGNRRREIKVKIIDGSNYENQNFEEVSLKKASVRACEFIDCSFKECLFPEVTFEHCTFNDCSFTNCELSLMVLNKSMFRGVDFENCRLLGVNWSKAARVNQEVHTLLKIVSFKDCILNYSSFIGLELPGLKLVGCAAHEVDFSEAKLSKADFRTTNLENAVFRNTDLAGTNFLGAKNYFIDPANNKISKAKFSLPDALGLLYAMDIELEERSAD